MIKNLTKIKILTLSCLALSACAGGNCLRQTSAASMTLGEIVYQANMAYDAQYIDVDTLEKIDTATDQAKNALDTARLSCVAEDKSFGAQMKIVESGLTNSLKILDEGKNK